MSTPEKLIPALRQYRSNRDDGLLTGYDYDEINKIVAILNAELKACKDKWLEEAAKVAENNSRMHTGTVDSRGQKISREIRALKGDQ